MKRWHGLLAGVTVLASACDLGMNPNAFSAAALTAALRANFATIFGITVANQIFTNLVYRKQMFDIAGAKDDPATTANEAYNQADFLAALSGAASLDAALTAALRANFATIFGITVANQIFTNDIEFKCTIA